MYYFVNKEKYSQIYTCSVGFYFALVVCAHCCNEIERRQFIKAIEIFSILQAMDNDVRFEYISWKSVLFCFISIVWVHFSHKTKRFGF